MDKAALLAALAPKKTKVPIEGFGDIFIRQLSVDEVEAIRTAISDGAKDKDKLARGDEFGIRLVMLAVADENGGRVFEEADLPALRASSNVDMDSLVGKALEFNGFKKPEGGEKKPDSIPSDVSNTA